ncbi:MAG: hypothetical protein HYS60_00060 [Candidatus Wildermuthbacteria bacterium]|nr:hypothetical protein [Candidatus Wildermuthbacteria bacterium]
MIHRSRKSDEKEIDFLRLIAQHPRIKSTEAKSKMGRSSLTTRILAKLIVDELIREVGKQARLLEITPEGQELLEIHASLEGMPSIFSPEGPPEKELRGLENPAREDIIPKSELQGGNPECKHHFIFERPNGPVSEGTCRFCRGTIKCRNWSPISFERFSLES